MSRFSIAPVHEVAPQRKSTQPSQWFLLQQEYREALQSTLSDDAE